MVRECVVCGGENTRPRSEVCGKACGSKRWRAENPEGAERSREMMREWVRQNPEANRARAREWGRANRNLVAQRSSQWKKDHPEKVAEYHRKGNWSAKRRARKAGAAVDGTWPDSPPQSQCQFCGSEVNLQCDHVAPLTRGGGHTLGNCQTLCGSCNSSKHNKLESELTPDFWVKVTSRIVERWANVQK